MEEYSSSKKALTLEEELEKEQSRIEELGQQESEEEDFSYLENDEEFKKKRSELQKAMERAARRHGNKTKSIQFSPETTGDEVIERIFRPQQPSPSPTPKTFGNSHQENCQELQYLQKWYILQHQLSNLKGLQYPQERLLK
ncbi:hypothetical protein O181_086938 [Austropuccinia psidii MF-1]|uniref:Uncharacterized protein n=1 Tax=Austropuccinia psidii MF-1 TaxID=1389203 RepID=A0A9Q3INR6_9BASI|nr:hypothetical protein [Austropuccinia psidii MF-1]